MSFFPYTYAADESPKDALQIITNLYKEKNFDQLIRERYSEIHKAEDAGKVDDLIGMFSKRFSDENKLKQVIQAYEIFLKADIEITTNPMPQKTETDKIAVFKTDKGAYKLYLQKTGKWGFHM